MEDEKKEMSLLREKLTAEAKKDAKADAKKIIGEYSDKQEKIKKLAEKNFDKAVEEVFSVLMRA